MKKRSLTPKQRLFVYEYLVDLNATQAAIRSGYSRKTAKSQGQRLLTKVDVKKAIDAARERRENKAIMTRDEILEELSIIGRIDPDQFYRLEEGGEQVLKSFAEMGPCRRAISEVKEDRIIKEVQGTKNKPDSTMILADKRSVKLHDKPKALELLGRHYGLFPTKVEGELTIRALSMDALKKSAKDYKDADGGN